MEGIARWRAERMESCAGWRVVQGGGLCRVEGSAGWRVVQGGGLCRVEGSAGWRVVHCEG